MRTLLEIAGFFNTKNRSAVIIMNATSVKKFYHIDAYLVLCHALLLAFGYGLWKLHPHIQTKPDMSGLFFMIVSILGGFAGLIILAVTLPRLDRSVRNLSVNKFFWHCCIGSLVPPLLCYLGSTNFSSIIRSFC